MQLEDFGTPLYVGTIHQDLPIKSAGTEERALSRISGRLVAAMMITPWFEPNPSISANN
jgi:hypothetical protein